MCHAADVFHQRNLSHAEHVIVRYCYVKTGLRRRTTRLRTGLCTEPQLSLQIPDAVEQGPTTYLDGNVLR